MVFFLTCFSDFLCENFSRGFPLWVFFFEISLPYQDQNPRALQMIVHIKRSSILQSMKCNLNKWRNIYQLTLIKKKSSFKKNGE